jgi:AcrR family transcriptional regulator
MPPAERRAALAAATLPLLLAHGMAVTTRQIAEASGVAEGTLFRVFPDKDAIIRATLDAAMDPAPLYEELARVDVGLPLRPRLIAATMIVQRRLINIMGLLMAVGFNQVNVDPEARRRANEETNATIARLLDPDTGRLRLSAAEVARMLRMLIFSGSHPLLTEGNPLSPEEIVTLLLDGVLAHGPDDVDGARC